MRQADISALRDDRPGDAAGEVGRVDSRRRNALAVVGRKHRLEHAVFANPLAGGEDQRVIGLGAGMERPVERLHDVFRADQRQIVRRVGLGVGAAIGRQPTVEAGDAIPVRPGVDPIRQFVEDVAVGHRMDGVPAWRHCTGAEIIGPGEVVAELGDVGVAQGPVADGRQVRCLPPLRKTPRRLADHLDPVAEVVPGKAVLEARFVSERQRHVGDVATVAAAGIWTGHFQAAAPVERVAVEQRRRTDQLIEELIGVRLVWRPVGEILLGAEPGQLQPADLDARLLERLGHADAVLDAGAVIVRADDDLTDSQLNQLSRVFNAPLAGAVGVGGGEQAESCRRKHILFTLDDQQGRCRVFGEDFGDRSQIEEQRGPLRSAG